MNKSVRKRDDRWVSIGRGCAEGFLALALLACSGVPASGELTAHREAPAGGKPLYYTGFASDGLERGAGGLATTLSAVSEERASRGRAVSRRKAIGASLLIPGWGQHLGGQRAKAKAFFVAELAILTSYTLFQVQGKIRQNRYIDYAEQFAGVPDASGREDYYYRNLGVYRSSEEYIDWIRRTARALYGDDLAAREQYVQRYSPGDQERWVWMSDAHRLDYLDQRKESRNSYRRASHMIGVALLNRVVSAVDAAFLAGSSSGSQRVYLESAGDGTQYVGVQLPLN
jgi:hypothetical protein